MDLKAVLHEDKIFLPDTFFELVARYKAHLFKWNRVHNLTGIKDEEDLDYFIYDALYPIHFLPKVKTAREPVPVFRE